MVLELALSFWGVLQRWREELRASAYSPQELPEGMPPGTSLSLAWDACVGLLTHRTVRLASVVSSQDIGTICYVTNRKLTYGLGSWVYEFFDKSVYMETGRVPVAQRPGGLGMSAEMSVHTTSPQMNVSDSPSLFI